MEGEGQGAQGTAGHWQDCTQTEGKCQGGGRGPSFNSSAGPHRAGPLPGRGPWPPAGQASLPALRGKKALTCIWYTCSTQLWLPNPETISAQPRPAPVWLEKVEAEEEVGRAPGPEVASAPSEAAARVRHGGLEGGFTWQPQGQAWGSFSANPFQTRLAST